MPEKTAVLFLNHGGPPNLQAVGPFMYNLFSDSEVLDIPFKKLLQPLLAWLITKKREKDVQELYAKIGGGSPIRELTEAQARALEEHLALRGFPNVPVYIGMLYWEPFIEQTVAQLVRDGVDQLVVIPLYPQFSFATTGSACRRTDKALAKHAPNLDVAYVRTYHHHADYQLAIAQTIEDALNQYQWSCPKDDVLILFSAHSLPEAYAKKRQDPYQSYIEETCREIMESIFKRHPWKLAYQSRVGPIKWLEPSTDDMLKTLAKDGCNDVLIVPISFVSDHIETLYEVDMLYCGQARDLGIANCHRAAALNTHPRFIKALAELVIQAIKPRPNKETSYA